MLDCFFNLFTGTSSDQIVRNADDPQDIKKSRKSLNLSTSTTNVSVHKIIAKPRKALIKISSYALIP